MKHRKIIYTIIAGLLPVIFLILLELVLVVFNAFSQTPLFYHKTNNGEAVVQINSAIGERYFNKKNIPVPNLYPQTFSANKSDSTFRVFCLGGSTTAGFPYEMTVPFPQQLKFLLENDFPKRDFEIINMGLSAINSFTVWDWIPDILDQEPDLIIIYMGHNEFYGAYGTGSTISFGHHAGLTRFVIKLQKLRTVQMLNKLVQSLSPGKAGSTDDTIMEKIIQDRFIAADSELRIITHQNYAENLDLILAECAKRSTPVILSGLVSNLKDQPPLGSLSKDNDELSESERFYQKGWTELSNGDSVNAYNSFLKASDSDVVPFRADSELNSIILEKAKKFEFSYVDMSAAFRQHSELGIPGDKLFCDHLHPNPIGYRIMANEFHHTIFQEGYVSPAKQSSMSKTYPIMVTSLDWEIGAIRIYKLTHHWPFESKVVNYNNYPPLESPISARIAKNYLFDHHVWGRAHDEMADYYLQREKVNRACAEYSAIIEMYPDKIDFYNKLIDCAKSIQVWPIVERTCIGALKLSDEKGMLYYNLAVSKQKLGKTGKAFENILLALKAPELNTNQKNQIYYTYATFLFEANQVDTARHVLLDILKTAPDYKPALELLSQISN